MRRVLGLALIGAGAVVFVWIAVTLRWGDPITTIHTNHEQSKLRRELDELNRNWRPTAPPPARRERPEGAVPRPARATLAVAPESKLKRRGALEWAPSEVRRWAADYRRTVRRGHAVGRIVVPGLNLRMVVVAGTSKSILKKGPGFYDIRRRGYATSLPGMGGVVAIAGHRTTYAHPFRHIDDLRSGDRVFLEMPYARFTYRIYRARVVSSTNWEILRRRGFEKLVLSACNPLHSLRQRYVVFARLIRTQPPPGLRA
jgi:sortase A